MPVNYGAYQIDPFQGFNQGLTNIGQALKYRREMERQTLLDAERKRLGDIQAETTRLSQISSRMGIEEVEATRKAESGLYSPEGGPPLDLAGTIQAKMEKEQNDKKRKQAFEKIKFIIDVNKSLGGTPEEKNKVIQGILANDPDENMRGIASSIKVEGDEVSFTKEVTAEDIAKSGIRNPDGSPAIPGIYDLKGRATGDPANPFRIIESKRRVMEKAIAPSWKVVQDPKSSTGYSYQDMNNPTGELRTGAPAPKAVAEVKIDIGGKSYTKMGEKMGERVVEQHKDAEQAVDSLRRLRDAKKLLSSGMITGAGAEYILSFGKVLQQGGISLAPDAIANTEAYAAMMGNQVGQIIKQFGAGTGLSDADREYAEKIAGGKITLTKQSLEKIIDLNERGLRNAVRNYNKRAKEIMDKPEGKDLPYDLRIDVPSGLMGEGGKGLIHYYVGDNEYFIPSEKESAFMKKYPNAKKAK